MNFYRRDGKRNWLVEAVMIVVVCAAFLVLTQCLGIGGGIGDEEIPDEVVSTQP